MSSASSRANSAEPAPIGRVTWTVPGFEVEDGPPIPGGTRTATLRTDGMWVVASNPEDPAADASSADTLNLIFGDAYRESGPADGRPGVKLLHDWAARVGGTVELEPHKPDPPGTIY
jgi:hypothetical protein